MLRYRGAEKLDERDNPLLGPAAETRGYTVVGVSPQALDPSLLAAWDELFLAQPAPSNPFLAPSWALEWYDTFVAPQDQVIFVVHKAGRGDAPSRVVAIVPMFVLRRGIGPIGLARRLLPVGAGIGVNPYEIPGLLCEPECVRDVAKVLTAACVDKDVDWAELAFDPDQCWFEGEWLQELTSAMSFGENARARACVILPLQPTWDGTRATLKRNVKESIRRSANRLKNDGRSYEVVRHGEDLDRAVVERFLQLHSDRSRLSRATAHPHPDAYGAPTHRGIMLDVLPRLGRHGQASMFELYLGGEHVASQLALHSPGTSYVHSSGFREDVWSLGVVTHLQAALVAHAVERGDTYVNFSPGPNVSKLRWSERLWVTQEFAFGAGPRSLTLRVAAFNMLSTYKTMRVAAARHRSERESAKG